MGPTIGRFPLTRTFTSCSVAGEISVTDSSPWFVTHTSVPSKATPMGVLKANGDPDSDATKVMVAASSTVTESDALSATKTCPSATARPAGVAKPNPAPDALLTRAPDPALTSVTDPAPLRTKM